MKLTIKTRGGKSPQGLPRVWYTGHPADLPAYAEEIAADLFETQDCAIYSDAEPDAAYDREELLEQLSQMQLFVIPVTSRFLFQPNRGRELEFAFATERHIPVLPLLQEQGLESAFNKICGDLQMLNKGDSDPTALPYAQKLEKFLSSVLVGDELATKIRAAFDAYVFLSYRKKDRKYAQELMRLIHKNDFCRDIAIWYDEFLTPGEDFNAAIAEALQKSSLFALAVTLNLTEPGNYVMALEYPKAREADKLVLPVELAPTDRERLAAGFPGLPAPTPAEDEPALSAALLEAAQRLAIRQNDADPEHNFFIGLAYLGGVDVEVNRETARELITGAAEAGLPEAMKKLTSMYRSGEGVARDYSVAVNWQEKLADWKRAQYQQSQDWADGLEYMLALCDLGNYQYELRWLDRAQKTYRKAAELCTVLAEGQEKNRVAIHRMLAAIYGKLGEICKNQGDLTSAQNDYEQGFQMIRQLCVQENTIRNQAAFASHGDNLGMLCLAKGDFAGAKQYLEEAYSVFQRLFESAGRKRDFFVVCTHMGDLYDAEGQLAASREQFERALVLARQLMEESRTPGARRDFAVSCGRMGRQCEAEGDFAAAQHYYEQNFVLCQQLFEELQTKEAQEDYCSGAIQRVSFYERMGRQCEKEGDLAAAREYNEQSVAIYQQLQKKLQSVGGDAIYRQFSEEARLMGAEQYCRNASIQLANVYREECRRAVQAGDARQEERWLRKILEVEEPFQQGDPYPPNRLHHALGRSRLGKLCADRGDDRAAEEQYLRAYELLEELHSKFSLQDALKGMLLCLSRLGALYRSWGELEQAERRYRQYLELGRKYSGTKGNIEPEKSCVIALEGLGAVAQARKDEAAVKRYRFESLAAFRQYFERVRTEEVWKLFLQKNSAVFQRCQGPEELLQAGAQLSQALEVWRGKWEKNGSLQAACRLLEGWIELGKALAPQAPEEARSAFDQALQFAQGLPEKQRGPEIENLVAETYSSKARALRGDDDSRKEDLKQAVAMWSRLMEIDEINGAQYAASIKRAKWKLRSLEWKKGEKQPENPSH